MKSSCACVIVGIIYSNIHTYGFTDVLTELTESVESVYCVASMWAMLTYFLVSSVSAISCVALTEDHH